ncbi:uncharacterized protein LOC124497782 isoform X2 [Dermatophagoides farinae]
MIPDGLSTLSSTVHPNSQQQQQQQQNYHYHQHTIKIVIVGDVQVGKTSLIQRFIANQLPGIYIPTGFDKYTATFEVGGHHFHTNIWDTSGSSSYDAVRPLVYDETNVFLICFNLGDWYSLHNVVQKWYPEIRKYTSKSDLPIILIGCQNDQRFIDADHHQHHHHHIYESSSTTTTTLPAIVDLNDDCKRKIVYTEEAMEISRQIGSITYVETSSYNPITVREAFEVAALSAHGKLLTFNNNLRSMMMMSPTISNVQTSSPFYGLKHFISLSTSSSSTTTATELSSPTTSINSDGSSNHSSSNFGGGGGGGPKLKTSSSSTHLTRNRSLFKLRKCKSKQDLHHHHQQQQQQQQQQHRTHGNGGLISMMMKIKNNNNVDNNNGHHKKSSSIISGLSSSIGDDNYSNSTNSCSNSEISKKSCIIM